MKVILVNGGPHKEGCTYTALREVADALEQNGIETEIFWLGNDPVAGCIDCGYCKKTDRCFRNDCVNEFLEKAADADGFVFGTPVHFASAAGALISFLDRAFYGRDFSGKVGAAVISCRRAGRVMFEIGGVAEETAREALRLAIHKLPIKCKIVSKAEAAEMAGDHQ